MRRPALKVGAAARLKTRAPRADSLPSLLQKSTKPGPAVFLDTPELENSNRTGIMRSKAAEFLSLAMLL